MAPVPAVQPPAGGMPWRYSGRATRVPSAVRAQPVGGMVTTLVATRLPSGDAALTAASTRTSIGAPSASADAVFVTCWPLRPASQRSSSEVTGRPARVCSWAQKRMTQLHA